MKKKTKGLWRYIYKRPNSDLKILGSSFYRRSTHNCVCVRICTVIQKQLQIDLLLHLTVQSCNTGLIGNAQCVYVYFVVFCFTNQSSSHHAPGLLRVWHITDKSQGSNQISVILYALHTCSWVALHKKC